MLSVEEKSINCFNDATQKSLKLDKFVTKPLPMCNVQRPIRHRSTLTVQLRKSCNVVINVEPEYYNLTALPRTASVKNA